MRDFINNVGFFMFLFMYFFGIIVIALLVAGFLLGSLNMSPALSAFSGAAIASIIGAAVFCILSSCLPG